MKRRLVLAGAGLAALLALVWWLWSPRADAPEKETGLNPLIEAALAVKGISLLQGEKGFELWRLKAEWAAMHQEDDVLDLNEPRVRYTLGEGGSEEYVYVSSDLGRITDEQRVLTLWQRVRLTRRNAVITGPKLVYTADDRLARFPDGAAMDSPEMAGTFTQLVWSMNANRVDGEGGIDVTFKARESRMDTVDTKE